jgi:hypothetical protein
MPDDESTPPEPAPEPVEPVEPAAPAETTAVYPETPIEPDYVIKSAIDDIEYRDAQSED